MPSYDDITRLVASLASKREPYNHHGARTAEIAVRLARELGLPMDEVRLIEVGAHLHDIGKVLVNSEILNVTRRLNHAERATVQTHTRLGWEVVCEVGYDPMIVDIVLHHHERLDGKGYPEGLKDEAISLAAQIVGVCDVYAALTSQRTYRAAYAHPVAMAMMQKDKRTKFSPLLVDLFFAKVAK